MTNALVEIGLVLTSVGLGLFGALPGFLGWSASAATGWWLLVHEARLRDMIKVNKSKAVGSFCLAITMILIIHVISFGLGYAFNSILVPK